MVLCSSDNSQKVYHSNLLNAVADVSSDGKYVSAIKDPDQKFGAFMSPLTYGRVTIASSAINSAKVGLAIVIRYSLSRRAFSVTANGPEVLLLDYPSHRRRLLPLLAKPYAMIFAANELKMIYVKNLRPTKRSMLLQVGSKEFTLGTIYEHFRNVVKLLEGKENQMTESVTGATGFTGRRLVQRLRVDNHSIRVLKRSKSKAEQIFPGKNVCLIGKGGQVIQKLRNENNAQIRVISDSLPICALALSHDELLQVKQRVFYENIQALS